MWRALLLGAMLTAGCGHSPTSPDPPPPVGFAGTVTDTLSGAPVVGFTATMSAGRVTVSAPGYVTHANVRNAATIDVIPESGFDVEFYRQFARGTLDGPIQPLRVLSAAPSIYLQTAGLTAANVAALEQAARAVVPALTGGRFQVQAWETGAEARPEHTGWIVVELVTEPESNCGRSLVGTPAGHIWLNTAPKCARNGSIVGTPNLFAHEIGHALGFTHVDRSDALMYPVVAATAPSDLERRHAAIAYARPRANTDLDSDP